MTPDEKAEPPTAVHMTGTAAGSVFQAARDMYVRIDAARSSAVVVPVQPSPPAAHDLLIGRSAEQQELCRLLNPRSDTAVAVVSGLAGVGKTALARHAAARATHDGLFPGGAVMVNLHGYEPALSVNAAQVFGAILRALGQAPSDIPSRLSEQAAAYHYLLTQRAAANRPVLLVLDNASTAGQVADLLPAPGPHRVLITSRDVLAPRIPAARGMRLAPLSAGHAADLLTATVARHGEGTTWPPPVATIAVLAGLCGHLPLALEIVAALITTGYAPEQLTADLQDTHTRLAFLDDGERAVRAAFDLSFGRLTPEEATSFALLSLNPGPEVATETAAALLDRPHSDTRRTITALYRAHLLEAGATADRWSMHDLLRLYADAVLVRQHASEGRHEALRRVLQYYSDRVWTEERCFYPPEKTGAAHDTRWVERRQRAIEWFDLELPNLIGAVNRAAASGLATLSVRIASHLFHYFDHYRLWPEWEATSRTALEAARASGDGKAQARLLCSLGLLLREQHRLEEARDAQAQSLELARETGDAVREGWAGVHLGGVLRDLRDYPAAAEVLRRAVEVFARLGDAHGQGWAHHNLGSVHAATGRLDAAVGAYEESIRVRTRAGDSYGAVFTWTQLGAAQAMAGQLPRAADCLQRSMDLSQHLDYTDEGALAQGLMSSVCALQDKHELASHHRRAAFAAIRSMAALHKSVIALSELGTQQADIGDRAGAEHSYREALDLLGVKPAEGHRLADQVAQEIARLAVRAAPTA
ncbi:tetratricopeptide repeat protein [Streptomyces aquilus]|uniref:tetratricopeptide repeat protein n=1 Tax=Streptomyces aquilus TaxID=2548456 RepID=UPI0036B604E4